LIREFMDTPQNTPLQMNNPKRTIALTHFQNYTNRKRKNLKQQLTNNLQQLFSLPRHDLICQQIAGEQLAWQQTTFSWRNWIGAVKWWAAEIGLMSWGRAWLVEVGEMFGAGEGEVGRGGEEVRRNDRRLGSFHVTRLIWLIWHRVSKGAVWWPQEACPEMALMPFHSP
jgi:hypothetical protein